VPGWLAIIAVATAVASVLTFGTVLLWPLGADGPQDPLEFRRFASVARIEFGQESRTVFTAVLGERGYTAWDQEGDLRVVAFDLTTGERAWEQTVTGAPQWSRIHAAPSGLLVFAYEADPTVPRRMFVLDPATGDERWHEDLRGDDHLFLLAGTLTWQDQKGGELRGLDPATGEERWRQQLPGDEESTVVPVLSETDLRRPAGLLGNPSPGDGDGRLVIIHPDWSARVVDTEDGRSLSEGSNIADPDDRLLGYAGRLFVAPAEFGYQLVSYDLGQLAAVPRTHYAAPDAQRYPDLLEPCGGARVCLLENVSFDRATTEAVVVDADRGGMLWRAPAPGAEQLLGIGQWVVAATDTSYRPSVVLYDGAGQQVLAGDGLAVRLNGSNLLMLAGLDVAADGVSVAGIAVEDWSGEPVQLGRLPDDVQAAQCSWSVRYLVCPDRTGAEIWQFAED
jgi:outer membrane protein assembly factor BamB